MKDQQPIDVEFAVVRAAPREFVLPGWAVTVIQWSVVAVVALGARWAYGAIIGLLNR